MLPALMLSRFSHVRHCATLWTVTHQAPLSRGFCRQEYRSGLPCPPPRDLPDQGSNLSPALLADGPPGKLLCYLLVPKVQTDQGPYLSLKFSSEPISCQWLRKLFPLSPFQNGALPPSAQLPAQASRTHTDVCVGDCKQPVHTHPDQ